MHNAHLGALAGLIGLAAPAAAWGAELAEDLTPAVAPPLSVVEGPEAELVVEGRRALPTTAFRLDRSVHSVDRQRLGETQAESTAAAVAQLPGAVGQVTNRGAGSPLLRGLIGPQNLIMIEGLRFNNATFRTGPNQYLATLDPSAIDRIELLLGPGGVMYGSDAMGGVIGLYLPRLPAFGGSGAPALRLWSQYASVDHTGALGGQVSWSRGPVALQAGGAWRDHGTLHTGEGGVARASDYRQWGWHARVAYAASDTWTLQGTLLHNAVLGAGRTDELGKGLLRTYDNADTFAWLEARRVARHGALRDLRLALVAHRMSELGNAVRCTLVNKAVPSLDGCATVAQGVARQSPVELPSAVTRQDQNDDEVTSLGALATAQLALGGDALRVSAGAELWLDQVQSSARRRLNPSPGAPWQGLSRGNYSDGSSYAQLGAFAHADYTAWRGARWAAEVNAGGRAGLVQAQASAVPKIGDVSFALPIFALTSGAVLHRDDRVAFFANLSTGLRAPNLQETTVLGNTGEQFEVPNADLRAEQIAAVELGARIASGGFRGQIAGFYNAVSDFIDREAVATGDYTSYGIDAAKLGCTAIGDPKCQGVVRRANLGSAAIRGAEISLRTPAVAGVHAWLVGTWLHGESSDRGVTQPLRRSPPTSAAAGLRWTSPSQTLYVEPWLRGASAQDRLNSADTKDLRICENPDTPGTVWAAGSCPGTPGWVTVNLRAGWRWQAQLAALRALRLDLDAGNLLDLRYRLHGSGIDAPGRGLSATLAAEW